MTEETKEELEIELDDETAAIAQFLAEERGITIEELITQVLTDAINTGEFENLGNE